MVSMVIPEGAEHLGGYWPGGDEATFYPDLWKWLVNELGIKTVLDVGCGDGIALRYFAELDCLVQGIDGVKQADYRIREHDYTTGSWLPRAKIPDLVWGWNFDLVWCCEFVEHIEEKFVPNFIETFKAGKLVLMTHAFPDQPGHHHVNCRNADYWKGVMAGAGFSFDDELTVFTRGAAALNANPWNHYVRSGMAFRRIGP